MRNGNGLAIRVEMDEGWVFEHRWIKHWEIVIDDEKAVSQCRVMFWLSI